MRDQLDKPSSPSSPSPRILFRLRTRSPMRRPRPRSCAPSSRLQGCTAYLTVQMALLHRLAPYACKADPKGGQRRVDMDEGGMTYFGAIDGETQWMRSYHVLSEHGEILAPPPTRPIRQADLRGRGRVHFTHRSSRDRPHPLRRPGPPDRRDGGHRRRHAGATEYESRHHPRRHRGLARHGHEYISRDWRMFLSGARTDTTDGESKEVDDTPGIPPSRRARVPVLIPKYGCGAVMSIEAPADVAYSREPIGGSNWSRNPPTSPLKPNVP